MNKCSFVQTTDNGKL